ncbi:MAG: DEAD/DEAH box helicase [Candidatus Eremiobacteraeota bacterium]|nr:DEAD/DEAH box helicase [Candidatus Eremiobacteraeota bacterium]
MRAKRLPPPTASEAAFERLLASFDARSSDAMQPQPEEVTPGAHVAASDGDAAAFLDRLYGKADAYLARDPYATIADAFGFNTKVAGISFERRQDLAGGLRAGDPLQLRREPDNPHDRNAVGVWSGALQLGFVKRAIAARIAPNIDAGERYTAEVTALTGGGTRSFGINIYVSRERPSPATPRSLDRTAGRADVLRALIGEQPLRDAQRAMLERVDAGRNTLAVLGTGRGKSLCYQLPAAVRALERREKTVVLYPLRALANDQYDALQRRLGPLGLRILRANGAIDAGERAALNDALETGDWDIVCATPEFVQFHLARFRDGSRPALVVVDEAHHVAESTHRPAYREIGAALAALGASQVLALTATARDAAFERIRDVLGVDAWVIDPTVRDNLHVVDARGTTNKLAYIERIVADGAKAIVYCNSRKEATTIAEKLRRKIGAVVAFYHAHVGSAERGEVERLFREGSVRVVVATSAFGEGIDLPDVRHVVLYHLNFDFTEFNQQAGRAGRDGAPASIHLLFGERDRNLNEYILDREAPRLETLRAIYGGMKRLTGSGTLRMSAADVAGALDLDRVEAVTVVAATRIFADAGLIETGEDDEGRYLRFLPVSGKVDLTASERYIEGEAERDAFERFADVVLGSNPAVLESLIDRPIYPDRVPLER